MWERAVADNDATPRFTNDLYQQLKSEGLLLVDFLDQQFKQLEKTHPKEVCSGLVLELLHYHTTPALTACERSEEELFERYENLRDHLSDLLESLKNLFLLVGTSKKLSRGLSHAVGPRHTGSECKRRFCPIRVTPASAPSGFLKTGPLSGKTDNPEP